MTDPTAIPADSALPVAQSPEPSPPTAAPPAAAATALAAPVRRRHRLSRRGRQSAKAWAARRANIAKARAVARTHGYRPTERRRAASRANLAKAHAWRRTQKGNEVARRNAFRHGLAVKKLPELLVPLGEGPEDLERHREMVWEVFRPQDPVEEDLAERLAQATWRRMRLFRACARQEIVMWRRLQTRGVPEQGLSQREDERRAGVISRRIEQSDSLGDEASALGTRILKLLDTLVAARSVEEETGD